MADGNNLPALASSAPQAVISFEQMGQMAESFAKSNLFGVKTKDAALSLLMIAQAEGIHPALAVMEYDIIEGKPARKAERLLARFQMSGGKVEWLEYSNTVVKGKFSHPHGSTVEIEWSIQDAARVKFWKKDKDGNGRWESLSEKYNWKSWPRAMLRSRVISEGVRACFPGASLVTLTTEEAQDAQFIEIEGYAEEDGAHAAPTQTTKSAHQQRKDGEDKAFDARIDACTNHGQLEALLEDPAFTSMRPNWQEVFRDKIHSKMDLIAEQTPRPALPSFDDLKASLADQKGKEAVKQWGASKLSAEILESLTDAQRDELRALFKAALHD